MRLRHGGLGIDIPDGWSDQSTLLFVAPRPRAELATNASEAPTEAISLCFAIANSDAETLATRHAHSIGADHEVLRDSPFTTGLGQGALHVVRLSLAGHVLRQYIVAVVVSGIGILASAACLEQRAASQEATLLALLASVGPARSEIQ